MKKLSLKVAVCLLSGSLLCSSCIGSFSLFNNYAEWQRTMSNNKFVNAVVGFVLMPFVGSICLTVDYLVLNTIEFWSGENPVAANVGKTQQVLGSDGRYYAVKTLKDGYEVTSPTGEVSLFKYDKKQNIWSLTQNGVTRELFRFNADGTITTTVADKQLTVTPDQAGLYQVRMAATNGNYFAMN
ncbi:MAG: DUF3332 domain-containing protein [Prevotella sp.]|nr:DUF3332 domain-containing protein [Prevotella sp.]